MITLHDFANVAAILVSGCLIVFALVVSDRKGPR